jgi:GcrA cell cycle regulator
MRDAWTAERVDLLRRLWGEGATAGAIAVRLAMSRSAVMGKVFRLRLNAGDAAASRSKRQKPADATSPSGRRGGKRRPPPPPTPLPPPALRPPHKTLLELTNTICRFMN